MCKDKNFDIGTGHMGLNPETGKYQEYPTQDEYWEMLEEIEEQNENTFTHRQNGHGRRGNTSFFSCKIACKIGTQGNPRVVGRRSYKSFDGIGHSSRNAPLSQKIPIFLITLPPLPELSDKKIPLRRYSFPCPTALSSRIPYCRTKENTAYLHGSRKILRGRLSESFVKVG